MNGNDISKTLYGDHTMKIDYSQIDERVRAPIKKLNELGFETSGSCQGADFTNYDDYREYKHPFDRSKRQIHSDQAYIQFFDYRDLPQSLIDLIRLNKKLKFTYFFESESDTRCEIQSVSMLLNKEFPNEVMNVITEWSNRSK